MACSKVAPKGSHPKVEASYLDLKGPQSFFQEYVTPCAVMLQHTSFGQKCQKLMCHDYSALADWSPKQTMSAHMYRHVSMKRFICDAMDSGYTSIK